MTTTPPDQPQRGAWPAWAPPCLIRDAEDGPQDQRPELIRRLLGDDPRHEQAWSWGIALFTEGGKWPVTDDLHRLLLRSIECALAYADEADPYGMAMMPTPGEERAYYDEIAAKARELAALIQGSAVNASVMDYLAAREVIDLALRSADGDLLPLPDEVARGERDLSLEEEERLAPAAAAMLRPYRYIDRSFRPTVTRMEPLLHALASDAESWGQQLADPAHHLNPRGSVKVRPKVFIRALARELSGDVPLDPAHLATLANAALGLYLPTERVQPHQVSDWLAGFAPDWNPAVERDGSKRPRAMPGY